MPVMDRFLVDRVGLFAVAAIFLITVALSDVLLSGLRLDLTENRLYTLSEGTVNILESIPETVNLYFFFSERAAADNGYLRNYAQRVREILEEFEEYAGSKLRVTAIDPLPFSEEEDRASAFGLRGISLGLTTDQVFLGIAGTNAIGDEETIAFLDPNKETLLEYELARLVYTLANPSKPTIGLISSLPMSGGLDPTTQQPREPWAIATQIRQLFDLRTLVSATQVIDSDFDLLMVVHPKNLSPATLYAIDQYILGGGRAILFVDPYAEADVPPPDPANPAAAMMANRSSNLQEILDAWGISVPGNEVIGDDLYALQVSGPDQRPIRHLGYLGIDSTGLDRTEVITTDLENIIVGYVGHIIAEENENLAVTPLIVSSDRAGPIDATSIGFMSDPDMLRNSFTASGEQYVIAARITGTVETAFPDGPPDIPEAAGASFGSDEQLLVSESPINVILVADTDILTDRFWVQVQTFLGQRIATAFASNGNFVINALENLTGSSDLIGMRSRESYSRPFTRVMDLRRQAENEFRLTEQRLQQELRDTEAKLGELEATRSEGSTLILSPEQVAELDRFKQERLRVRKELRQVQRGLDQDIEDLGSRIKAINIGLVPLLIVIGSFLSFLIRRRKPS
jgi:ABC-type uncharacterized transport system involved in gliding motility auxiliary subunit